MVNSPNLSKFCAAPSFTARFEAQLLPDVVTYNSAIAACNWDLWATGEWLMFGVHPMFVDA